MDASDCDVAFTNWGHWHGIPWQDVHQVVGRLQARIVKAAKAGDWRNVKRLQRLLTRSNSAKALAVKRVTENQGRKTPGIDRQTWSTPDDKWQATRSYGGGRTITKPRWRGARSQRPIIRSGRRCGAGHVADTLIRDVGGSRLGTSGASRVEIGALRTLCDAAEAGRHPVPQQLRCLASRTAYVDWPDRKRLLWRLWLSDTDLRPYTDYVKQWDRGVHLASTQTRITV